MTATIFNFTVPTATAAADYLADDPESATGTLFEAILLAMEFDCDVTLTDEAGFKRGWVHADGNYSLS